MHMNLGFQHRVPRFSASANPAIIGKGQTMRATQVTIQTGTLGLIRAADSGAHLKRDVWTVTDDATGQTYTLFQDDLDALDQQLAAWGKGAKVEVAGVATKPVKAQNYPFLNLSRIVVHTP